MADDVLRDAPAWVRGKTLEDFAAVEEGNRLMIPDALVRLDPKGKEHREPLLFRIPVPIERAKARRDAVDFAKELCGDKTAAPWTVERAHEGIGVDVFENLDSFAILALALREPSSKGPAYTLRTLVESWPPESLFAAYDRLDFYARAFSVRLESLTEEQFWAMAREIARVRNLSPFAAIGGDAQRSFVVRSAEAAWSSRTSK